MQLGVRVLVAGCFPGYRLRGRQGSFCAASMQLPCGHFLHKDQSQTGSSVQPRRWCSPRRICVGVGGRDARASLAVPARSLAPPSRPAPASLASSSPAPCCGRLLPRPPAAGRQLPSLPAAGCSWCRRWQVRRLQTWRLQAAGLGRAGAGPAASGSGAPPPPPSRLRRGCSFMSFCLQLELWLVFFSKPPTV